MILTFFDRENCLLSDSAKTIAIAVTYEEISLKTYKLGENSTFFGKSCHGPYSELGHFCAKVGKRISFFMIWNQFSKLHENR